jgi:hypothetical protein
MPVAARRRRLIGGARATLRAAGLRRAPVSRACPLSVRVRRRTTRRPAKRPADGVWIPVLDALHPVWSGRQPRHGGAIAGMMPRMPSTRIEASVDCTVDVSVPDRSRIARVLEVAEQFKASSVVTSRDNGQYDITVETKRGASIFDTVALLRQLEDLTDGP